MILRIAQSAEDSLILARFDLVKHLTKNEIAQAECLRVMKCDPSCVITTVGCRIQRQVGRGAAVSASVFGG